MARLQRILTVVLKPTERVAVITLVCGHTVELPIDEFQQGRPPPEVRTCRECS